MQYSTELEESIKQIIEREGFTEYNVNKTDLPTIDSFLGLLSNVEVKGKDEKGDKELNIFVKNITSQEQLPKILSVAHAYNNEVFAYKELFNIYDELQEAAGVPLDKRYKNVKCYEETSGEVIIMENMTKKGFNTYYLREVASLKFVELSIQELAKFHALSFILKERKTEYFNEKIKPLKHFYMFNEHWKPFVENIRKLTIAFVDEDYKEKVDKLYTDLVHKLPRYINDENTNVCLCHGDYRTANLMTKMENGEEQEIIPIDFQLIYYGCPVFDILYFVNSCTDREFRKAHMSYIKDLYYDTLRDFLKYFELDADTIYPREEFERAYNKKLDYGLMISILTFMFMFPGESISLGAIGKSVQIDGIIKERLRGVFEDYAELGYI